MNTEGLRSFEGAVAIITGGASGIGLALGQSLAKLGAHIVLADLQIEIATEEAERIKQHGGKASAHLLDVRDASAYHELVDTTFQAHGRIDYLFNNAGINAGWDVKDDPLDDWNYIIDINIRGVVHGIHAVYPLMVKQGFGHIINTSSSAGLVPALFGVSYSMTKHAVVGLSTSLRGQAKEYGVQVSVLCPGFVDTPIIRGGVYGRVSPEVVKSLEETFGAPPTISTDTLVRRVLPKIKKNKAIIVEPRQMRIIWYLYRIAPTFVLNIFTKGWLAMKQKLKARSES